MDKSEYIKLRMTLDFKPRGKFLAIHIAGDFVLAGLACALVWRPLHFDILSALRALTASLSLAVLYFRAFSMMHEGVHGAILANRRGNDWAGLFYGALCFLPFTQWREIHLLHHQWSGNVEKDPVRKITVLFRGKPTFLTGMMSFFWPTWIPAAAAMQNYVFWSESLKRFRNGKGALAKISLALPVLLWASAFYLVGWTIVAAVLAPSILFYLALVEMVNFPHHTDLPQHEGDIKAPLWEQHKTARSCFYPRMFEHFVLLNFNYHIEHHLYPTLPWHQLKGLNPVLRSKIPDYFYSNGNEWVVRNRRRSFREVCLSQSGGSNKEAA